MIDNKIIEMVNSYDYKNEVDDTTKKLEAELEKCNSNKILHLQPKFDGNVLGSTEDDIANKMAERLINYKIREKAFVKLMTKGLIYPVGSCDGLCSIRVNYQYGNRTTMGQFQFRRFVFNEFMKA